MAIHVENELELLREKIASSIRETLSSEVRTPEGEKVTPCDVYVPEALIEEDDSEENCAQAAITYVSYAPEAKRHTVYIRFKYSDDGKFLRESMTYV